MTLIDYKDAGVVATEVIMTRQLHAGSFLILEGEDDHKFWSPRVAPGHCELVIGNGKPNVEGALVRLDKGRFRGALGVVDDDFDGLAGRLRPSPNLIGTDTHDLECMLIRSPALERVLAEFAAPAKIRELEARQGHSVRDALLERGLEFGRLRWVAQRLGEWLADTLDRGGTGRGDRQRGPPGLRVAKVGVRCEKRLRHRCGLAVSGRGFLRCSIAYSAAGEGRPPPDRSGRDSDASARPSPDDGGQTGVAPVLDRAPRVAGDGAGPRCAGG